MWVPICFSPKFFARTRPSSVNALTPILFIYLFVAVSSLSLSMKLVNSIWNPFFLYYSSMQSIMMYMSYVPGLSISTTFFNCDFTVSQSSLFYFFKGVWIECEKWPIANKFTISYCQQFPAIWIIQKYWSPLRRSSFVFFV